MRVRIRSKSKTISQIYIDEESWGILPDRVLRSFDFDRNGNGEICVKDLSELKYEIRKHNWNKLLNYLAYKERSSRQCFHYLRKHHLHESMINELLEKARSLNYLNDLRFAELYTESLISRNKSIREIQGKLAAAGIMGLQAEEVLAELYPQELQVSKLEEEIKKLLIRYRDHKPVKRKEKIMVNLTRRGYRYEDIKRTLREALSKQADRREFQR